MKMVDLLSMQSSQKLGKENLRPIAIDMPLIMSFIAAKPPVPWYSGMQLYVLSPPGPGRWPNVFVVMEAEGYRRDIEIGNALGRPVVPLFMRVNAAGR